MLYPLYVFDAYGTLFDVHGAVARHHEAIGPAAPDLSSLWRSKQLEYTWVRSLSQRYADFYTLTREALDFAAAQIVPLSAELRDTLMRAYEELPAYADAAPTLQKLKKAGARTAILSNGTPKMLEAAVQAAALAPWLDAILSVDDIGIYKTDARAYQMVVERCGVRIEDVSFQSSNRWDIAGAAAFGFRCVWVNRAAQPDEYRDLRPARMITELSALSEDIGAA